MNQLQQLIQWKTDAWKDPGMVDWYNRRMHDCSGINRLKNRVEEDLCSSLVKGRQVLEVGIGTGRASIPLARQGFEITGVDSSQAMLNQCATLAEGLNLNLRLGDVTDLPLSDGAFDTVMGVDLLIHFPHPIKILEEWKRVTRPGGRIFFNLLSKDHYCLAQGISAKEADRRIAAVEKSQYCSYLSSREIVALADTLGLTLYNVAPYGALMMGYPNHWIRQSLENKLWWKRFLSHMATDDRLFEFALFLEAGLVQKLSPLVAPRLMLALDNQANPLRNADWLDRQERSMATMQKQIDLECVNRCFPAIDGDFAVQLAAHLQPLRNQVFFYKLLHALSALLPQLAIETFVERKFADALNIWTRRERVDAALMQQATLWHQDTAIAHELVFSGVPLGPGFEYALMNRLVADTAY